MTDNHPSNHESSEAEQETDPLESNDSIDPPPFFRKWRSVYILVISVFIVLVILFYLFTKAYE